MAVAARGSPPGNPVEPQPARTRASEIDASVQEPLADSVSHIRGANRLRGAQGRASVSPDYPRVAALSDGVL